MEKQNVAYPYNGILFGNKKERGTDACYNKHENIMLHERSQLQKTPRCMIVFICNDQNRQSIEAETRSVLDLG